MIDFVKLYWRDKNRLQNYVLSEGNFDEVYMVLERHSGEIRYPYTSHFSGMKVGVNEKSGYVKNSIHKAYNIIKAGVEHNSNDFTYSNVCEMIDYLSSSLVDLDASRITQLEFGINVPIDIPAEVLIRRNILMHKLKRVSHNKEYYGNGKLIQFDHHNYAIKIYDKAKQYKLDNHVIRVEVKFFKAKGFQEIGIFNIQDLKSKMKLRKLFLILLQRFDELTIIDEYQDSWFNLKDLNALKRYINSNYWEEDLRGKTRQTKSVHRKRFEAILNKYDLLKTKRMLRGLLVQKFIHLINH